MMRDLSVEGFAVRAMMPLRAGEKTPFMFSLSETVRIDGEGEILWVAENGRVAGIRFTHVSPSAGEQIQEWLVRLEKPPGQEDIKEQAKPASPTLEELREEIHSIPPRTEQPATSEMPPHAPVVEAVAARSEPVPVVTPPQSPAPEIRAQEPPLMETAEQKPPVSIGALQSRVSMLQPEAAPPLPRLSLTPKGVQVPFHESPSATGTAEEATIVPERLHPSLPPESQAAEEESCEPEPHLPDISTVLMQPFGRPQKPSWQAHSPEPTPSWESQPVPGTSWMERVSLTKAIAAMGVLAVVVGLYVFHRNVGQGLIWLGEELGGVEQTRPQATPVVLNSGTNAPTEPLASRQEASSQPPSTANAASGAASENEPAASEAENGPQASLSAVAKNPLPPVAPLSGIPSSGGTGSETGQSEYLQAMQILRGKNADADTPQALRLLWASVEKGNPSAEVALAELYWYGRGVPRNCAQTRILLTAAARKGSAEAQKKLEQFQNEGCE